MVSCDGWRARIGLIIPAPNTVAEPWLACNAPVGVTIHTARLPLGRRGVHDMDTALPDAVDSLLAARVDAILYGCTSSGMSKGMSHERAFQAEWTERSEIPFVTAALSVVAALDSLHARRLAVLSPYTHAMEDVERRFLADAGFDVVRIHSLGLAGQDLATPSPESIYREARRAWDDSADVLFVSCLNFRAQEAVEHLERDLGVPVLSSLTASIWNTLRALRIAPAVPGFGRLLAGDPAS